MRRLATLLVVAGIGLALAACEPSPDCGRVLTQDTTLRADVLNCQGDGLVIGADGIEVRLAGHTIDGTGAEGSAGIRVAGHDGVVVSGPGLVKEFDDGVQVEGGSGNRVRYLRVTGNQFGIHLVGADNGRVVGNDVTENEAFLSSDVPRGVLLEDADGNLLSGNTVREDDYTGIELLRSHGNRLVGNAVNHSDGANILLIESDGNEVVRNNATGSNTNAISLSVSRRNLVAENEVGNTASAGIRVRGSFDNHVIGNVAVRNDTTGIDVSDSSGTLVERNVIADTGEWGIRVRAFSGSSMGNRVRFNTVTGGDFFSLLDDGIEVAAGVTSTIVRGNTTNGMADDGIDVDSPSTTIRDNTANDNGDLGIEAVPGVIDGGGNRATGNGNPAQCTGVVCT